MDNVGISFVHGANNATHPAIARVNVSVSVVMQIDAMAQLATNKHKRTGKAQSGPRVGDQVKPTVAYPTICQHPSDAAQRSRDAFRPREERRPLSAVRIVAKRERPCPL